MELIDSKTRKPLSIGDKVVTSSGEHYTLEFFRAPHKPSSSGFVYVQKKSEMSRQFYPEVIGAEFFPRTDRECPRCVAGTCGLAVHQA